jgi:hypothetical protein
MHADSYMPRVTRTAIGIFTPASADEEKLKASPEGSHQASDKVKSQPLTHTSLASRLAVQKCHLPTPIMSASNPPKGRNASKSTTKTPSNRDRVPNKVTTTKKDPKASRTAKATPRSSHSKIHNNNRISRHTAPPANRKDTPEDSKPTANGTPTSTPAKGFESWLTPSQSPGAFLFDEAPPKICLDEILKRVKSPSNDKSVEYGRLTPSQITDTASKIDQYEAKQGGKQPTIPASKSDYADATSEITEEVHTNEVKSITAESSAGKDQTPEFVTAAKMLAKARSRTSPTPDKPASTWYARTGRAYYSPPKNMKSS